MSKVDTWMPLHIGAYLADTMHLQTAEHGAYLLLLMHYWRHGPLPDDDAKLAGIARMDRKAWGEIAPTLRAFFTARGGQLHQKRADAERARAARLSATRRAAAGTRWAAGSKDADAPHADAHADEHANADANAHANADANAAHADANADAVAMQKQPHARVAIPQPQQQHPSLRSGRPDPRGARLPAGWQPDATLRAYASGLGLDPAAVAEAFSDFWTGKAGEGARKADWGATWRIWCRREAERAAPLPTARGPTARGRTDWLHTQSAESGRIIDMEAA